MSESFSFYIVDEEMLPSEFASNDDQSLYEELVSAVESSGEFQNMLEMTEDDFVDALESIDKIIGGDRMLPICAMNNSPHEILGKSADCPYLGYFSPGQVQNLLLLFEGLDESAIDTIESVESHSEVYSALLSAIEVAQSMGYSLAILHA